MRIVPWQGVEPLRFGALPRQVEAHIGLPVETRYADEWTICDYGNHEIACVSYYDGRFASALVVPTVGTMLWDGDLNQISAMHVEKLLLANGHEVIRRPPAHIALRYSIEAPTAGLHFTFTNDCCDAVSVQAAILANLRYIRDYRTENASEAVIERLDEMLVALDNT